MSKAPFRRKIRLIALIIPTSLVSLIAVTLLWLAPLSVLADETPWSAPKALIDIAIHDEVAVAADPYGQVHVLWINAKANRGEVFALYHAKWDGQEWSAPGDVIVESAKITWPVLASGNDGRLYACWLGSDAFTHFSQADAADTSNATAWSPIEAISHVPAMHCDVKVAADGAVHVLYAAAGGDVFHIRSDDQGATWSAPISVSAVSAGVSTDFPRLAIDDAGGLHTVWTNYASSRLSSAVLGTSYARSLDGGATWSTPDEITSGVDYAEINVLARGEDEIHLAWNGRVGFGGRYHQWSRDRGQTWSSIEEVIPKSAAGGGKTGPPDMGVDSSGTLYLVSGMNPGGVMAVSRTESGWSQPLLLESPAGWSEKARIAVSEGNRLNVISQEWYFSRTTNAARLLTEPVLAAALPTPQPSALPTVDEIVPVSATLPTVAIPPGLATNMPTRPTASFLSNPVVAALIPTVLLVCIVFVIRLRGMRR